MQGGSGKTVIASALARDSGVRTRFEAIMFLQMGQSPVCVDLRASNLHDRSLSVRAHLTFLIPRARAVKLAHVQLLGSEVNSSVITEAELFKLMSDAAAGRNLLLIRTSYRARTSA